MTVNANSIVQYVSNSNQKWNNDKCQCDSKKYCTCNELNINAILDRIRYLIGLKSGLRMLFLIVVKKIKIDSDDDLPLEKTLTMYNAVFLVKSVFNKNKNYY